ncbi:glycosyltransferase family 90 protein [Sarocladium strictum]
MKEAEEKFEQTKKRQSKTLEETVREYRRRYGIPPPPNFDKWWEYARAQSVQLVDEFDTIYDVMTPFWGISPKTIRYRAREALSHKNHLVGVAIRDKQVTLVEGGPEWQRNATKGMLEGFLQFLPDMDLAFNVHDEPRVMVPHDDLSRLVRKAKEQNMAAAGRTKKLKNGFSGRPEGMNEGTVFEETKLTRFNVFPQQATWTNSRMSCSPMSPARTLDDEDNIDDLSGYSLGQVGFVYNTTAMTDICSTPSLRSTWGFFGRPNAFSVVHDLFPIFSQSKISSYADIIYPSPWYWNEQVVYDEERDMAWDKKEDKLYWRGSTTGGFSREGGWRRQHRQSFVQQINARDDAKIMANIGTTESPKWEVQTTPRGDHRDLIDVHFSHIGQCDAGDCEAQNQFFEVVERVDQQDAWGFHHLLDMDGNAFSGRFYAFLRSNSLVYKLSLFREWHMEWLRPWVHFIPLSLQGQDWLEVVRFFGRNGTGSADAERMAAGSREWANKVVRKEDMEVWFFRLLLEYARVIDDDRESIGFDPDIASG